MRHSSIQYSLAYLCILLLLACNHASDKPANYSVSAGRIKHAKRFNIISQKNYYVVSVFGNRQNHDATAVFVVAHDTSGLSAKVKGARVVKIPCQKIAALSSIYASIFYELGVLAKVAAIDNADYVVNPELLKKHKNGALRELAKTPRIDLEQTMVLKPDMLFTFGMGNGEQDQDKKLMQTGIPVAISVDHLEETPLARAEWLKFFAVFADRLSVADSLFDAMCENYNALKALAAKSQRHPTVFNEIKYSEFWYMPGGRSNVACLIKDAGAEYTWKDNLDFGSLPLSFEQVYARAKNADYWINLSTLNYKSELLANESRYAAFKAFQNGNLYNNNLHTNTLGYSTYWETGMIHPDRILSDLIQIFHPELKGQLKNDLYYYKQIK